MNLEKLMEKYPFDEQTYFAKKREQEWHLIRHKEHNEFLSLTQEEQSKYKFSVQFLTKIGWKNYPEPVSKDFVGL